MASKYRIGEAIHFRRIDGAIEADVVRGHFIAEVLLEPYGRNERHPALILTHHSWCRESDVRDPGEGK